MYACMYVCMYVLCTCIYVMESLNVIGNYMVGYDGSVAIPHMFPTKRAIMK